VLASENSRQVTRNQIAGKDAPVMTGSPLIPVVAPLVMLICLGIWIVIVFYADAHPDWKHRPGPARTSDNVPAAGAGQDLAAPDTTAAGNADAPGRLAASAEQPGQDAAEPSAPLPGRRAA
jgi:hypothetical protein